MVRSAMPRMRLDAFAFHRRDSWRRLFVVYVYRGCIPRLSAESRVDAIHTYFARGDIPANAVLCVGHTARRVSFDALGFCSYMWVLPCCLQLRQTRSD